MVKLDNFEHISSAKIKIFFARAFGAREMSFFGGDARENSTFVSLFDWRYLEIDANLKRLSHFEQLWWLQMRVFCSKVGRLRCTAIIKTSLDPFKRNVRKKNITCRD